MLLFYRGRREHHLRCSRLCYASFDHQFRWRKVFAVWKAPDSTTAIEKYASANGRRRYAWFPFAVANLISLSQLPDVLQHAFAEAGDAGGELLAGVQTHAELAADAGADRQGLDARELAADHHLRHH